MSLEQRWYRKYLRCPDCGSDFVVDSDNIKCSNCCYKKPTRAQIDLKPINPRPHTCEMLAVRPLPAPACLQQIETTRPEMTYIGPRAIRDSRELMSEICRYVSANGTVLDLGCGPRDQAIPIEHLGYRYVGVDYTNTAADILADAHALPFTSNNFDCVLSYAVLEHLHNPFIAIREIERVLKPDGVYVGTVSQGEPFHESYFHLTPWGMVSLAQAVTSLEIQRLWDSGDTLGSLAKMGRYPCVIRAMLKVVNHIHDKVPYLAPRRMRWPDKEKSLDKLYRAGSVCFVLQKPNENHITSM